MGESRAWGSRGDTTHTKIFVGGLAWETQRDAVKRHFQQFGEILEAVVITDKSTGRSKGYGFVTFKDPESAARACQDPNPIIDGRKTNCNIAALGAQKKHTPGSGNIRAPVSWWTASPYIPNSTYYPRISPLPAYPYASYSTTYLQPLNPLNYYNAYGGGNQYSSSYYRYYPTYEQGSSSLGFTTQFPPGMRYSQFIPPSPGNASSSLPASAYSATSSAAGGEKTAIVAASGPGESASEDESSA